MTESNIVYIPVSQPLSEMELANAFNVPIDDSLRRAINQTLERLRDEASADHPSMVDNLGKLAYSNGYEQAILKVMHELNKCYSWAGDIMKQDAQKAAPQPKNKGY
jgi:hypothetical protein